MIAWTQRAFGEPLDVLELAELPEPTAEDGVVVVEPHVVGISAPDLLMVRGEYQGTAPPPLTVGAEIVGRVVGATGVDHCKPGDRVMGMASPPSGGLASRVAVPARHVDRLPDSVPDDVAVCLPVNYVTAHLALHERASVRAEETVLVLGAPGGVGSATVDLAVAAGARVIASVRTDAEARACRALGATVTEHVAGEGLTEELLRLTDGQGVDVVVDPVGGDGFDAARRALAFAGRIVVVGFMSGRIASLKTNALVLRNVAVLGVNNSLYMAKSPEVHAATRRALLDLAGDGRLHPVVAGTWQFADAPAALNRLAQGGLVGKALVRGPGRPG